MTDLCLHIHSVNFLFQEGSKQLLFLVWVVFWNDQTLHERVLGKIWLACWSVHWGGSLIICDVGGGARIILLIFKNFHQIFHRFTLKFCKYTFSSSKTWILCIKIWKFQIRHVEVQPCTPLKIMLFSKSDSWTTFYYVSWKRCVISHWMTAPKNRGGWYESPRFIGSEEVIPIVWWCLNQQSKMISPYKRGRWLLY